MTRKIFYMYLVCIHIVLMTLLINSNIVERVVDKLYNHSINESINYYMDNMYAFQRYQSEQMSDGHNFLIGDSIALSLNTANLNEPVINWGIGHNSTSQLLRALDYLPALKTAKNIFLIVGINDIKSSKHGADVFANLEAIFDNFHSTTNIFVVSVVQVSSTRKNAEPINKEVNILNNLLEDYCAVNKNINFIDLNSSLLNGHGLNKKYDRGDGLHLNSAAYLILSRILNEAAFDAS